MRSGRARAEDRGLDNDGRADMVETAVDLLGNPRWERNTVLAVAVIKDAAGW